MSNWVQELLEALERLAQVTQANTAAVHSLVSRVSGPVPAAEVAPLANELLEQLELAGSVIARLEELRQELAAAPERCRSVHAPIGEGQVLSCDLSAGHAGLHYGGGFNWRDVEPVAPPLSVAPSPVSHECVGGSITSGPREGCPRCQGES